MVEETLAVVVALIAGIGGGFLSSWMSFNASGDVFSGRKHGNALITGALSGLALGVGMVVADPASLSVAQFALATVGIFLAAVGIDRIRSNGSDMIANTNSDEKKTTPP